MAPRTKAPEHTVEINNDTRAFFYDAELSPLVSMSAGESVRIGTLDARSGALLEHAPGMPYDLPRPTPGMGNPLTGPIRIEEAVPGDALVVRIDEICVAPIGWCGGHAHVGPLPLGRIPRPIGRTCRVVQNQIEFSDSIRVHTVPMIGCIGTATAENSPSSGMPGRNGGNMDHPVISEGAKVYLPVFATGGLLFVGDVHAAQGDGELSGVALEIPAEVTLTIEIEKGLSLSWPWFNTGSRIGVMTSGANFAEAREHAVDTMVRAMEAQLDLEPADALALISVAGDLRIGQAFGAMNLTLRLEMPADLGLRPSS